MITPILSKLNHAQKISLLDAAKSNSQIIGSIGFENLLSEIQEANLLSKSEMSAELNKRHMGIQFSKFAELPQIDDAPDF